MDTCALVHRLAARSLVGCRMAFSLKSKLGIPDSRYAAELGKSASDVKFAPELEEGYDSFFLAERRSQVRSFNGMLCALSLLALIFSFAHDPTHDALQRLRLSVIVLGCAAITWAAFTRLYQEVYLGTARWASLVIAVFGAFE